MDLKHERDERGLVSGVDYQFNEDGTVNWRAMIKQEFLYPNKGWFELRNKPVPNSIEGLDDKQLLIMLGGIKELAKLRGFVSVSYEVIKCEIDHVAVKCRIEWMANFEQGGGETFETIRFESIANATTNNTSDFASKFLESIAENRAFVRCVRNFLNIHIVGADEIDSSSNNKGSSKPSEGESSSKEKLKPLNLLKSKLDTENFDDCKKILRGFWKSGLYKNEDCADWQDWKDIPTSEALKIISLLD